jgi:hypothetical protein
LAIIHHALATSESTPVDPAPTPDYSDLAAIHREMVSA